MLNLLGIVLIILGVCGLVGLLALGVGPSIVLIILGVVCIGWPVYSNRL